MKGGTVQISWHENKPILTIDFHPGTTTFATAGADHEIRFWSIKPAKRVKKLSVVSYLSNLTRHTTAVNVIRFSPSGEFLASGADEGEMIIWQLHSTDTGPKWKVFKLLGSHLKDILDLQWSTEATYIITGSVDNCCIIWDAKKGTNLQILEAHAHYVQGVAWDPLGEYVSSLSSDRTCRIYANKPHKSRGIEKINYVCERVISKADKPLLKNSKDTKFHLFHDDTLPSFFRRLAWSPDGLFLLVPAGSYKINTASETVNAAYIISRRDLSRPAIQLPCANKAVVAVRFCPIFFKLNATNSHTTAARFFNLPYRIIFAVATLNSLYIYDTESTFPLAVFAGLHYAAITDITWSSDGHYLALSSQDGFCSLVEFENNELGSPYSLSEVKVSKKDSKTTVQTANDTVTVLARNISAVLAESKKMESEGKAGDMVTESSSNIGAAITKNKRTVIQEKPGNMVIEATGNVEGIIADSRKKRAIEKTYDMITETDDMIIETTGTIGTAELDRRKAEPEDMAAKQPASPDSDGKQSEATEEAGQNKPAKKRITPTMIDP